jgi:hypothetical protein
VLPTLAFVLVTGFTLNNGSVSTIVVPGLADENECHKLALKLNTPKHGSISSVTLTTLQSPMSTPSRSRADVRRCS